MPLVCPVRVKPDILGAGLDERDLPIGADGAPDYLALVSVSIHERDRPAQESSHVGKPIFIGRTPSG